MARERTPRDQAGAVTAILATLRKAPGRVRRQSRDLIETAVSQLFDAAVRQALDTGTDGEYRIDDLARLAGTTTRNVRVYRDRGLLHPPLRVGRIAVFNDTHLTRLRLITSMLDRGYTLAHVDEMLSAWEQGKSIGDVLGLETALAGTWAAEKPETMTRARAEELVGDPAAFDRLVALRLIRLDDEAPDPGADSDPEVTVVRPKLLEAFEEIRGYGIGIDKLIDVYEQTLGPVTEISNILVRTGAEHVTERIRPGEGLPADTEIAELITMLVRFRTQAVAQVAATLAASIEASIETLAGQILNDLIDQSADAHQDGS
ncbi:MerR family transcriptional regulator [Mycolicibacterium arseniciresistens]|uniref:MerR family transcriptional regulator n=1 Tax=Mycolicibacterium arseniciresistens TaxID=3062257 RepID=A0ABT8UE47_9MYCO|nr:MerR family transcriptional regulator [Mycolicibacterium arseniciresistens]MDO3636065.1 MerR family transcriptional regulator [Mycolicibacterium arseniciresistens]